jgi:Imm-5 like putative immunity protein
MRDRRFIAVHRGGLLDVAKHRLLASWAADSAEHVLSLFEQHSSDDRPRRAIDTARAWARGEVPVGVAQKAAVAAHAAARAVTSPSACAAARAAGHAVATVHMADHCLGAPMYALKAVEATGTSADEERAWQLEQVPDEVRELILSGAAAKGIRLTASF